jgi:hypothetical protein
MNSKANSSWLPLQELRTVRVATRRLLFYFLNADHMLVLCSFRTRRRQRISGRLNPLILISMLVNPRDGRAVLPLSAQLDHYCVLKLHCLSLIQSRSQNRGEMDDK